MIYVWLALTGKVSMDLFGNKRYVRPHWFYRLKAAICLLLYREPTRRSEYDLWSDSVVVTITDGGISPGTDSYPTTYWHEAILVGRGIGNWWACVAQASSD